MLCTLRGHIVINLGRAQVLARGVYYIADMRLNNLSCTKIDGKVSQPQLRSNITYYVTAETLAHSQMYSEGKLMDYT